MHAALGGGSVFRPRTGRHFELSGGGGPEFRGPILARELEAARHDADNLISDAIERDGARKNALVTAEPSLPEIMADDDDARAGLVVIRVEIAAEDRIHPEE